MSIKITVVTDQNIEKLKKKRKNQKLWSKISETCSPKYQSLRKKGTTLGPVIDAEQCLNEVLSCVEFPSQVVLVQNIFFESASKVGIRTMKNARKLQLDTWLLILERKMH